MEKIYILKQNKLFLGPYSIQKLKERPVKATDMVWYEGLPDWTEAQKIELLKDVITSKSIEEIMPKSRKTFKDAFLSLFIKK